MGKAVALERREADEGGERQWPGIVLEESKRTRGLVEGERSVTTTERREGGGARRMLR